MRVYVVIATIDYSGSSIEIVFDSKEKADNYIKENPSGWPVNDLEIQEWNVK